MSSSKKNTKSNKSDFTRSEIDSEGEEARNVSMQIELQGETPPGPHEWQLVVLFNDRHIYDAKWTNSVVLELGILPWIDLIDPSCHVLLAQQPIIFLLRTSGGKPNFKDPDPLTHVDNRGGGTVDLLPLVLGEQEIHEKVRLLNHMGQEIGCKIKVHAYAWGHPLTEKLDKIPLVITMISAQCLPSAKDDTFYVAALSLDGIVDPFIQPSIAANFGLSLNKAVAKRTVWPTTCTGGPMTCTAYHVPDDDIFIPSDVVTEYEKENCHATYWYSVARVLVEPELLKERLETPFYIELAGVPRMGKIDVRGRFMGFVDAKVLLVPAQTTVTVCASLRSFIESELPENVSPCLDLPPVSGRASAREKDVILKDSQGHTPFITIKFDLPFPLVPKKKVATLFGVIGFQPPEKRMPLDELYVEPPPEDPSVDVRKIRKEAGARAVHEELSSLACTGTVPMPQGIKRSAANKLLTRIRTMLRQFPPGDCSYIEWQDTVTGQHAASRRAVSASFKPRPPVEKPTPPAAPAQCRTAGDSRLADRHIEHNLKVADTHPRHLLAKALRLLEDRTDSEAKKYVYKALKYQSRNRFLLWVYGGMEFDKGQEAMEMAEAAFMITVKGDTSDGTSCAIGWAALHTLFHINDREHEAFVAIRNMRKAYRITRDWRLFLQRWIETSGQEEILWVPGVIRTDNPLLIASAFFLCLRCYKFSEMILQCLERGCSSRGCHFGSRTKITADINYLRAASFLLKQDADTALDLTLNAIKRFGPSAMMSQMRTTCSMVAHGWDEECLGALEEAERAGADLCPNLLLKAAEVGMKRNPDEALQRAARVHKTSPSAYSALLIARIYRRKGEMVLAERWAAAAVKKEPLLADGWAVLALLAMGDRDVELARVMLRTARQAGPLSEPIERQLTKIMKVVEIDTLPDSMSKNLCLCEYFQPNEK